MTPPPDPLLDVEGLCTRFFTKMGVVKAVEDVSFSVRRGEVPLLPCGGAGVEVQVTQPGAGDVVPCHRVVALGKERSHASPSFTTRREEAANQMIELIRAYPEAAPLIGDLLAKNLDWPGADEVAKRLQSLLPDAARGDDRHGRCAAQ